MYLNSKQTIWVDPPSPLKILLLLLHSPSLTRYLSLCSCLLDPGKWKKKKKTKHKMEIKGFKWPKRTHPSVSKQIDSGSFYRLFVELFALSRAGLLESIPALSSFLKRHNICRNKCIILCMCYSPGSLLRNSRFWCNDIRPNSAVIVHTTLTII